MDVALLSQLNDQQAPEDHIFSMLFQEDELTWQSMIHDLVRSEQMDPWDINISVIADRFIGLLKKMQELDFRISGKFVLAAATLVKLKSDRLMKEDIVALDGLLHEGEDVLDELPDSSELLGDSSFERPQLLPRTPQPRQRKVSVFDLIEALEKALEVETKKQFRHHASDAPKVEVPEKKMDMTLMIKQLHDRIKKRWGFSKTLTFEQLLPGDSKEEKVFTFIPLLHLDFQREIDLSQKEHFGPILIKMKKHRFFSS